MTDRKPPDFTDRFFVCLEGLALNDDRIHAHSGTEGKAVDGPFLEVLAAPSDRLAHATIPLGGGPETCFRMPLPTFMA